MSQSLSQIYLHVVFSTKERRPFLQSDKTLTRMHEYLGGICRELNCPAIRIGGVEDHVHVLCRLGRSVRIADLVRDLKRDSSKWVKDEFSDLPDFAWQSGYGAFSLSPSHLDRLVSYVSTQHEHHRKESFQDEFRRLLRKYDVDWDERYVWD